MLKAEITVEDVITGEVKYRGYTITYRKKPIPIRSCDFEFSHDSYDGPPSDLCGTAESLERCKEMIDELEQERLLNG